MTRASSKKALDLYRIGCGVDVGSKELYACILYVDINGTSTVHRRRKFDNSISGCQQLAAWVEKNHEDLINNSNSGNHKPAFRLVFEATGSYHEQALYECYEAGIPTSLVMALAVNHYRKSTSVSTKTDKSDAEVIARFAAERMPECWKPASPMLLELREVLRMRAQIVKRKTQDSNRLHAYSRKKIGNEMVSSMYISNVKLAEEQASHLERLAIEICKKDIDLYAKLERIVNSTPGAGWLTVLTLFAETNGFTSIKNMRQLTSYAGLDVVEHQSGAKSGKRHISKRGNKHIRRALYMAAVSVISTKKGGIYELGRRVRKRNPKLKKKGTIAVMRKLLIVICALYRSGESFDCERGQRMDEKQSSIESKNSIEKKRNTSVNEEPAKEGSPKTSLRLHEVDDQKISPDGTKILRKNRKKACIRTQ